MSRVAWFCNFLLISSIVVAGILPARASRATASPPYSPIAAEVLLGVEHSLATEGADAYAVEEMLIRHLRGNSPPQTELKGLTTRASGTTATSDSAKARHLIGNILRAFGVPAYWQYSTNTGALIASLKQSIEQGLPAVLAGSERQVVIDGYRPQGANYEFHVLDPRQRSLGIWSTIEQGSLRSPQFLLIGGLFIRRTSTVETAEYGNFEYDVVSKTLTGNTAATPAEIQQAIKSLASLATPSTKAFFDSMKDEQGVNHAIVSLLPRDFPVSEKGYGLESWDRPETNPPFPYPIIPIDLKGGVDFPRLHEYVDLMSVKYRLLKLEGGKAEPAEETIKGVQKEYDDMWLYHITRPGDQELFNRLVREMVQRVGTEVEADKEYSDKADSLYEAYLRANNRTKLVLDSFVMIAEDDLLYYVASRLADEGIEAAATSRIQQRVLTIHRFLRDSVLLKGGFTAIEVTEKPFKVFLEVLRPKLFLEDAVASLYAFKSALADDGDEGLLRNAIGTVLQEISNEDASFWSNFSDYYLEDFALDAAKEGLKLVIRVLAGKIKYSAPFLGQLLLAVDIGLALGDLLTNNEKVHEALQLGVFSSRVWRALHGTAYHKVRKQVIAKIDAQTLSVGDLQSYKAGVHLTYLAQSYYWRKVKEALNNTTGAMDFLSRLLGYGSPHEAARDEVLPYEIDSRAYAEAWYRSPAVDKVVTAGRSHILSTDGERSVSLSNISVSPAIGGNTDTIYAFSVTYNSSLNQAPQFVRVYIDNNYYAMGQAAATTGNALGFTYTTGPFSKGSHTYYFMASDGTTTRTTETFSFVVSAAAPAESRLTATSPVPVDGKSVSVIRASLLDAKGSPMSGVLVSFTTNNYPGGFADAGGTIAPGKDTATTDSNGVATVFFRPTSAGTVNVTASTASGLSASTSFQAQTGTGSQISQGMYLFSSTSDQSVYRLDVRLKSSAGVNIHNAPMTLSSTLGEMSSSAAGPWQSQLTATTDEGRIVAYLRTTSSGQAYVTARYNATGESQTNSVYLQVGGTPSLDPGITLTGHTREVFAVAVHGHMLASVERDDLKIWDTSTWTLSKDVPGYQNGWTYFDAADAVAFSPDGATLAIAAYLSTIDVASGAITTIDTARVISNRGDVSFNASGSQVAVIKKSDKTVNIWNLATKSVARTLGPFANEPNSVAFSPNGSRLAVTVRASGNELAIYNTSTWEKVKSIAPSPQNYHYGVAWSPDSTKVAVATGGSAGRVVRLYTADGIELRTFSGHTDDVTAVAWSPDGTMLTSQSLDSTLKIWDAATGAALKTLNRAYGRADYPRTVVWTSDNKSVVALNGSQSVVQVYFPFDAVPPALTITSPANASKTQESSVPVAGQAIDDTMVNSVKITVNNGTPVNVSLQADGTFSQTVSLSPGSNTIKVEATDVASHSSSVTLTVERVTDTTPPAISNVTVAPSLAEIGASLTITAAVSDLWSGLVASSVVAKLQHPDGTDVATVSLYDDGTHGDSSPSDGLYTGQWTSTGSPEGLYYIDVSARDNSNNTRTVDNANSFTLYDLPLISTRSVSPSDLTDRASIAVSATVTDTSGIALATLYYSNTASSGWTPLNMSKGSGDSWSATIPPQPAGSMQIRVQATDSLGNNATSAVSTYSVRDATPPIVISKSPAGTDVPTSMSFSVSFSEGMDRAATESAFSVTPSVAGTKSWSGNTLSFLPSGNLSPGTVYTVTVSGAARDAAGNGLDGNLDGRSDGSPSDDYRWSFATAREVVGLPDLVITQFRAVPDPFPYRLWGQVRLEATVKNQGQAVAGPSKVYYYLEPAGIIIMIYPSPRTKIGESAIPQLAPGESYTATFSPSEPFSLPITGYYLIAQADGANTVAESNENNNEARLGPAVPGPLPIITSVTPSWGFNSGSAATTIGGTGLGASTAVTLKKLGQQDVAASSVSASAGGIAVIFDLAGAAPGEWDILAINPDGQRAYQPVGFRVIGPPTIESVRPSGGTVGITNTVAIMGQNLAPGAAARIGETPLIGADTVGFTSLTGRVPSSLAAGVYTVTVTNADGRSASRASGYTVFDPRNDDLFISSEDIWTDPSGIHAGETAAVGVNVHRRGGKKTLEGVEVAFYDGDPASGGKPIGQGIYTVPFLAPRGTDTTWTQKVWNTAGLEGEHTLYVIVDPNGKVSEPFKENNRGTRTITILPPSADTTAPSVTSFTINGGAASTYSATVALTQTIQDNAGGSGVHSMYFVEYEYNQASQQWVPVQESGWVSYSGVYSYTLAPRGGVKYLQLWARDAARNISLTPAKAMINYVPTAQSVSTGEVKIYRLQLAQGASVAIVLETVSGDADLYVWKPSSTGQPDWISNNEGTQQDWVTFVAPEAGVYQIEVYGYADSTYNLSIQGGTTLAAAAIRALAAKTVPSAPQLSIASEPAGKLAISNPPIVYRTFVPLVARGYASGW